MARRVVGPLGRIQRTHGQLQPNVIPAGSRPKGGYPVAGTKLRSGRPAGG